MTVAGFMELALYDPSAGYYARAAQRSGRAGDFFTSVDVGPLFGELLALQITEMLGILRTPIPTTQSPDARQSPDAPQSPIPHPQSLQIFDLVEAAAGNGRLSADILRAVRTNDAALYDQVALHLVETSRSARDAQRATLGDLADRLQSSSASLPESFEGVLIANELLDAMPTHQVVMREDGLKEVFVEPSAGGLAPREREPSTERLEQYLNAVGARLEPGWRAEINLCAVDWVRDAARRLTRGFIILIDYGHHARELYSVTHATGTLTSFSGHRSSGPEVSEPLWLQNPGEQDITAHVDFTSIRAAAEAEGMVTIALLDQTYFVLGLTSAWTADTLSAHASALKTLMMPGGLGSTMKVLILGKAVGTPTLRGRSFGGRFT